MKKFLLTVLFLIFSASCVLAKDLFVDNCRLHFYKKYACYNKTYNDYNEVLKEFPENYYYATVKTMKARKPVLFVTDSVYNYNDTDMLVADYAIIFAYKKDKKVHVVNLQCSDGYPLSASKRFFFWGGEDTAGKYSINSSGTYMIEKDIERRIKDDNVTYNYYSYKGLPQGIQKKPRIFNKLYKELDKAKPIQFKQIKENLQ